MESGANVGSKFRLVLSVGIQAHYVFVSIDALLCWYTQGDEHNSKIAFQLRHLGIQHEQRCASALVL